MRKVNIRTEPSAKPSMNPLDNLGEEIRKLRKVRSITLQQMAKATSWTNTDAQVRKRGERTGLDTLVVHAINDVY